MTTVATPTAPLTTDALLASSRPFLDWLVGWYNALPAVPLADIIADNSDSVAIVSVDVIQGFCTTGPLASPRINRIVEPIATLLAAAWDLGVRHIALAQDTHDPQAVEFNAYPPHCVRESDEAETVEALRALPFYDKLSILPKNSINANITPSFQAWLDVRPKLRTFIIVGDCTDICTYQTALGLRVRANEFQKHGVRVIVPETTTDTFDTPVDNPAGAIPHNADLLHLVFLHSMMLNGVEVVKHLTPPQAAGQ